MKPLKTTVSLLLLILSVQNGICQDKLNNKSIVKRYIEEVINKQSLQQLDEFFADSFLVHILADGTEIKGTIESHREFLTYLFKAFPDFHYTIGDIIEEGDKIAMRLTFNATHENEFWGHEGSGNRIDYFSEIFFYRLENKKIMESWVQTDLCALFKKLKGEE